LLVALAATAVHFGNALLIGIDKLFTRHRGSCKSCLMMEENIESTTSTRRDWVANNIQTVGSAIGLTSTTALVNTPMARANDFQNPNIPAGPEEKSGLVVLRVAEVAQFQEKILRAVANGDLDSDITVSPQQIVFGTQILLRNSNLDGNMKLMIYKEVPDRKRKEAIRNAVKTMNILQNIAIYAGKIDRPFEREEMLQLADMYRDVKVQLNQMYEYLPEKEKEKYYGYFVAVTEYEKKIAEGIYNPDIYGVLKFND